MTDPVAASDALDEQLMVVKQGSVLSTRTAAKGFGVLAGLLLAVLGGIVAITWSTNATVRDRQVLEQRNAELEADNAVGEDLLRQAVDAVVLLQGDLRALGVEPREIIIRPTTTTTVPE